MRRVEILRHRDRAHQQARLEPRQQVGNTLEELADRQVAAAHLQLALQDTHLGMLDETVASHRHSRGQSRLDQRTCQGQILVIELAELLDLALVLRAEESTQSGLLRQQRLGPPLVEAALKGAYQLGSRQTLALIDQDERFETQPGGITAGGTPVAPALQAR